MIYKSLSSGITVVQGRLYKLDASEIFTVEYPGNRNSPPRTKTFYPPTQEVLKELYDMGHSKIILVDEPVIKTKLIRTKKSEEEEE
jgi:hypothetical protein